MAPENINTNKKSRIWTATTSYWIASWWNGSRYLIKGEILMNRRTEMGGVRVERTQYRIWGGNKKKEVDGGRLENQNGAIIRRTSHISWAWGAREMWRSARQWSGAKVGPTQSSMIKSIITIWEEGFAHHLKFLVSFKLLLLHWYCFLSLRHFP